MRSKNASRSLSYSQDADTSVSLGSASWLYSILLKYPSQVRGPATRWMEQSLTPYGASPSATLGSAVCLDELLLCAIPIDEVVVTGTRPRICGATHMFTETGQITSFVERRIAWLVVRAPSGPCRHLTGEASPRRVVLFIPGSTGVTRVHYRAWMSADDPTRSAWVIAYAIVPGLRVAILFPTLS